MIGAVAPEAEGELAEGEVAEDADLLGGCLKCFPAGTPVRMADGTAKSIETLHVGDVVASRDPATGEDMPEPVVKTLARTADALVTVALVDPKTGQASSLTCTPEHPLYVHGKGFVPAGAVGIGSQVVTRAGPLLSVKSVSWQRAQGSNGQGSGGQGSGGFQVFNVEVQDTHSYFAGNLDGGVWVHNIECEPDETSQPKVDAGILGNWFRGGGTRGSHEGQDALEQNWDNLQKPSVDQLRAYADIARRSIQDRGIDPDDITDIQVRRLNSVNRALDELGLPGGPFP